LVCADGYGKWYVNVEWSMLMPWSRPQEMTIRPSLAYRMWLGPAPSCHVATPLASMNLTRIRPISTWYSSVQHHPHQSTTLPNLHACVDEREAYTSRNEDAGDQQLPREHASLLRAVAIIDFDVKVGASFSIHLLLSDTVLLWTL